MLMKCFCNKITPLTVKDITDAAVRAKETGLTTELTSL